MVQTETTSAALCRYAENKKCKAREGNKKGTAREGNTRQHGNEHINSHSAMLCTHLHGEGRRRTNNQHETGTAAATLCRCANNSCKRWEEGP